jgi:hypothetical protein
VGIWSVAAAEFLYSKRLLDSPEHRPRLHQNVIVKARSQQHIASCSRKEKRQHSYPWQANITNWYFHLPDTNKWTFTASCTTNTFSGIVGGRQFLSFAPL